MLPSFATGCGQLRSKTLFCLDWPLKTNPPPPLALAGVYLHRFTSACAAPGLDPKCRCTQEAHTFLDVYPPAWGTAPGNCRCSWNLRQKREGQGAVDSCQLREGRR